MKQAFVFPGQGSQYVNMGKDFYDNFLVAKETFQEVDEALQQNLSKVIFTGPIEELTETQNTQPALMAVSMAIIRTLAKEANISVANNCSFVAGHSLGEYTALAASNAIGVSDTAKLLSIRGNAMKNTNPEIKCSMAAIIADFASCQEISRKQQEMRYVKLPITMLLNKLSLADMKQQLTEQLLLLVQNKKKR